MSDMKTKKWVYMHPHWVDETIQHYNSQSLISSDVREPQTTCNDQYWQFEERKAAPPIGGSMWFILHFQDFLLNNSLTEGHSLSLHHCGVMTLLDIGCFTKRKSMMTSPRFVAEWTLFSQFPAWSFHMDYW